MISSFPQWLSWRPEQTLTGSLPEWFMACMLPVSWKRITRQYIASFLGTGIAILNSFLKVMWAWDIRWCSEINPCCTCEKACLHFHCLKLVQNQVTCTNPALVYNSSVTAAEFNLITAIGKYLIIGWVTFLTALFHRGIV